jgi:hypothetical protein
LATQAKSVTICNRCRVSVTNERKVLYVPFRACMLHFLKCFYMCVLRWDS